MGAAIHACYRVYIINAYGECRLDMFFRHLKMAEKEFIIRAGMSISTREKNVIDFFLSESFGETSYRVSMV